MTNSLPQPNLPIVLTIMSGGTISAPSQRRLHHKGNAAEKYCQHYNVFSHLQSILFCDIIYIDGRVLHSSRSEARR